MRLLDICLKDIGRFLYSFSRIRKWMPMRMYLQCYWRERLPECGELDLDNPKTVAEKQQWIKIHDHKKVYTVLADKYRSKKWLEGKFGAQYVVKALKKYNQSKEINLEELPRSFVLKCNHDSGNVFICKDKQSGLFYDKHMNAITFEEVKRKLDEGLKSNYYILRREWCYKHIKPCIFAEEYLVKKDGKLPNDYKLVFINGHFEFVYVSFDREGVDDRCIYDINWNRLPFVWGDSHSFEEGINTSDVPRPDSFEKMLEFGKEISALYRLVRVDFFDVDGQLYFGEITQFHTAGFARFSPSYYDEFYGNKIDLKRVI